MGCLMLDALLPHLDVRHVLADMKVVALSDPNDR